MERIVKIHFVEPNKENLEFLESLNLTYAEMISCFDITFKKAYLSKLMKKYGIYHKNTYERVYATLIADKRLIGKTLGQLVIYFKCDKKTIMKARDMINDSDRCEMEYK